MTTFLATCPTSSRRWEEFGSDASVPYGDGLGQWEALVAAALQAGTVAYAEKQKKRAADRLRKQEKEQEKKEEAARAKALKEEETAQARAVALEAQKTRDEQALAIYSAQAQTARTAQLTASLQQLGPPLLIVGVLGIAAWLVLGRKKS